MIKSIKVFVASPSDVVTERKKILAVCDELNRTLGRFLEVRLDVLDWYQVPPDSGNPEQLILETLRPDDWDLFIGILWMRFGSPTGNKIEGLDQSFSSGTEQEFRVAYDRWQKTGQPRIMFYRCVRPPRSLIDLDTEQFHSVEQFFKKFDPLKGEHPGLFRSYKKVEDFVRTIRMDLAVFLIKSNPTLQRKLADVLSRQFLQVLLQHLSIVKPSDNRVLTIDLGGELELVTDSEERSTFHTRVRGNAAAREELRRRLADVVKQDIGYSTNIDCREWPLRYANGGVLPIVRVDGKRHLCLFYRETFPTGWNIANGASDNYQEILNPEKVLLREFSEELLIVNDREQTFYCFRPGSELVPLSYQAAAIRAWASRLGRFQYESYSVKELPIREWVKGNDSVEVRMGHEHCLSKDYFLSITPDDNAIEVDRVAYIDLDLGGLDYKILDGEGLTVGRIVGLFDEERFLKELSESREGGHNYYPDVFFFEGERLTPSSLDVSSDTFRSRLQARSRSTATRQTRRPAHPYDLCPITKALAAQYMNWLKLHD